jgi:hypothetical protein
MNLKEKNASVKIKISASSIVLYVAAIVVALIAIAGLINNILLYNNTVTHYVAQGYPAKEVVKQLIPQQLLPGIFEPIAVYGGIAFVLFGAGIINQRVSKCVTLLTKVKDCDDDTGERSEKNVIGEEDIGVVSQAQVGCQGDGVVDNSPF